MPDPTDLIALMARDRLEVAGKLDGNYENARIKRINIWNTILDNEITTGSTFLVSMPDQTPYICIGLTRETFLIPRPGKGGDRFWAYLDRRYGVSENEGQDGISRYVLGRFRNYAMQNGARVEMRRFSAFRRIRVANAQVLADVNIWENQRYTHPPGLATAEARGFRDVRRWARRFYAAGELGSGTAEQDAGREAAMVED